MPRGIKKENLPTKVCVVCNRPYTWRKKWEKVWNEVTTCSKSCNRQRRQQGQKHLAAGTRDENDDHDGGHSGKMTANFDDDDAMQNGGRDYRVDRIDSLVGEFDLMTHVDDLPLSSTGSSPVLDNSTNNRLMKLTVVATLVGSSSAFTLSKPAAAHQNPSGTTAHVDAEHSNELGYNCTVDIDDRLEEQMSASETVVVGIDGVQHLCDDDSTSQTEDVDDSKAQRKVEKKRKKAQKRAQREGTGDRLSVVRHARCVERQSTCLFGARTMHMQNG